MFFPFSTKENELVFSSFTALLLSPKNSSHRVRRGKLYLLVDVDFKARLLYQKFTVVILSFVNYFLCVPIPLLVQRVF